MRDASGAFYFSGHVVAPVLGYLGRALRSNDVLVLSINDAKHGVLVKNLGFWGSCVSLWHGYKQGNIRGDAQNPQKSVGFES